MIENALDYIIVTPGRTGSTLLYKILNQQYSPWHSHNAWISTDVPVIVSKRKNFFREVLSDAIARTTQEYISYGKNYQTIEIDFNTYRSAFIWHKFWYDVFELKSDCVVCGTVFFEDILTGHEVFGVKYDLNDYNDIKSPYTPDVVTNLREIKQYHNELSSMTFEDVDFEKWKMND